MSAPSLRHRADATATVAPLMPERVRTYVGEVLERHPVAVRLAGPRRTKLGDHRPPGRAGDPHRISINSDLNPWAFLTTLLHEVAHAATWERHCVPRSRGRRRRVRPHGREWQEEFSGLVRPLVVADLVPGDIAAALVNSLHRPRAATCSDRGLLLALRRYDREDAGLALVEELPDGAIFRLADGTAFRAGRRARTRRQCFECRSGREYRVHCLAQVEVLSQAEAGLVSELIGPSSKSSHPRE